ncbi:MAG: hypothetical protein ACK4WM_00965 [Thermoflexales bacterium]
MPSAIPAPTLNRIFAVVSLIVLTPALLLVMDFPAPTISADVLGSALSFQLNQNALLLLALPVLTVLGTDWVLQDHPEVRAGIVRFLFPFWTVPAVAALTLALLLTRAQALPTWLLGLVLGGLSIGLLIAAEYNIIASGSSAYEISRVGVNIASQVLGLLLFVLIHSTRERSLVTATGALAVAFALAVGMLAPHLIGNRRGLGASALIALLIGQAMWALNYVRISSASAGIVLLAIFHISITLVQQHLQMQGKQERQTAAEFALIVIGSIILLWAFEFSK